MNVKGLSARQRAEDLARMANETFDVVVIGGGVTGTGTALDAVTRGLSVALVEQRDYASGTSSRSSKLFHGGLRYLEQFKFGLVREALAERNLMLNHLCPHLARPVSFVYPLKHRVWERPYVGAGVLLYDIMASRADSPLPRHEHLSQSSLLELAPAIDPDTVVGAIRYWDARIDDARHTMMLARTAASYGAALASSTRVQDLVEDNGQVTGVKVIDLESGHSLTVRARRVINATGVWTDDIEEMASLEGLNVQASKGIHLVVPRDRIRSDTGMILRTEGSVLFVIPWDGHWIIGTTDTPWNLRRDHPAASRTDIEYLLKWANTVLTPPLAADDIVGVYAGLRPLLVGETDDTSKLSREHAVLESENGLISVAGGKYTTYRVMARDAVDIAAAGLGPDVPESRTDEIPIVGAADFERLRHEPPPGTIAEDDYQRLLGQYGSLVTELAALIEDHNDLSTPLVDDAPYLKVEVIYAASHEGALHLDDVLTRRTRVSIETRHRGTRAATETARLMGTVLGWDQSTQDREIEHYLARVDAERDSQRQLDDQTADAARMGAPDVRTPPIP